MHKRERMLVGAIALLLGGWTVDSVIVQPTIAWFATIEKQTIAAQAEAGEAQALIERQTRIMAEWRGRHAAGLLDDEGQARFRLQKTLQNAAQSSGFNIASVSGGQLIPAGQELHYDVLRLTISGNGSLSQVQAFVAAIEGAAMPLAIERSEWSAGDARKDHLDVALTLSTRLVSAAARPGRSVPSDTVPWTPAARDPSIDVAVAATKPFLADRQSSPPKSEAVTKTKKSAVAASAATERKGWAVVGIVIHENDGNNRSGLAFLRHQSDGTERSVRAADVIDTFTVVGVDANGLRLSDSNGETTVAVGQDLTGQTVTGALPTVPTLPTATSASATTAANTSSTTSVPSVTPAAAAAPFQIPTATADPARDAILQRLREKRNRTP
jgi:hypothetical protein